MRLAGYILIALALIQAIVMQIFGLENTLWLASFGLCMAIGAILLLVGGVKSLMTGELELRPREAFKLMPDYLIIIATLMLGFHFLLDANDKTLGERMFMAAFLSVFLSFYSTTYRKPV